MQIGSASEKEVKKSNLETIDHEITNKNNVGPFGWVAICYVTITNSETGETKKVYGTGQGSTQASALANCGANARSNALTVIDNL